MALPFKERLKLARQGFKKGLDTGFELGGEDLRQINQKARALEGMQAEMPKGESMLATHPGGILLKQGLDRFLGREDNIVPKADRKSIFQGGAFQTAEGVQARKEAGIDLSEDTATALGQLAGTFGADLTQDATRRFYWLVNALQATTEIINETTLAARQPRLYGKSPVLKKDGSVLGVGEKSAAVNMGAADWKYGVDKNNRPLDATGFPVKKTKDAEIRLKRGYSLDGEGSNATIQKRNFEPGLVQSLSWPTGIAVNSGLGLLTPFGGAEGYKAAVPSEEDVTKTDNVLAEMALKYFMGRTGQLLPYDEFRKVRPDVSVDEFGRYKAFKYDKDEDWNPLDGDLTLAAGALKWTNEGIHGPEVQFLGRSLPLTTGILPTATALMGAAGGVTAPVLINPKDAKGSPERIERIKADWDKAPRIKDKKTGVVRVDRSRPIRGGFIGGMAGLAVGQIAGNLLEQERRRRNAAANELNGPQY